MDTFKGIRPDFVILDEIRDHISLDLARDIHRASESFNAFNETFIIPQAPKHPEEMSRHKIDRAKQRKAKRKNGGPR